MPRFWRAHDRAQYTACSQNLHNIATALEQYAADNSGATRQYPSALSDLAPKYLLTLPSCPAAAAEDVTNTYVYGVTSDSTAFSVYCKGSWHVTAGLNPDEPWYDSVQGLGPK